MVFELQRGDSKPVYLQIKERINCWIDEGSLGPSDQRFVSGHSLKTPDPPRAAREQRGFCLVSPMTNGRRRPCISCHEDARQGHSPTVRRCRESDGGVRDRVARGTTGRTPPSRTSSGSGRASAFERGEEACWRLPSDGCRGAGLGGKRARQQTETSCRQYGPHRETVVLLILCARHTARSHAQEESQRSVDGEVSFASMPANSCLARPA